MNGFQGTIPNARYLVQSLKRTGICTLPLLVSVEGNCPNYCYCWKIGSGSLIEIQVLNQSCIRKRSVSLLRDITDTPIILSGSIIWVASLCLHFHKVFTQLRNVRLQEPGGKSKSMFIFVSSSKYHPTSCQCFLWFTKFHPYPTKFRYPTDTDDASGWKWQNHEKRWHFGLFGSAMIDRCVCHQPYKLARLPLLCQHQFANLRYNMASRSLLDALDQSYTPGLQPAQLGPSRSVIYDHPNRWAMINLLISETCLHGRIVQEPRCPVRRWWRYALRCA